MNVDMLDITKSLEEFFETKVPKYEITIANSRQEYNQLTGKESSESWMAGWAGGKKIVAIHPDKLEESTDGIHKSESHPGRIKHELAHLFYRKLTKGEFRPAWLNEGLASYLDGRDKNLTIKQERKLAATDYFYNHDGYVYQPGSFMVKELLDKFGKEKLLNLIKTIRPGLTEDSFRELFKNTYGFSFTKDDLKNIID